MFTPSVFPRGGSLLLSIYADARYIDGVVVSQAANQWDDFFWLPRRQANNPSPAAFAQGGLLSTRSGHNWLVEHNVLRHAKTIGIDIGDEGGADPEGDQAMPPHLGNHTVQWNRIVDNGGKGITGEFGSVGPCEIRLGNRALSNRESAREH